MPPEIRTRFAPSPTGLLHLGHAFSALTAEARARGGKFLVRIEDLDRARCRPEYETALIEDLHWLGLRFPPPLRQSDHLPRYQSALDRLIARGLCYPCACSRSDIRAALAAPQEGAANQVYPGTCRQRRIEDRGPDDAIRLNLAHALAGQGVLDWLETGEAAGPTQLDPALLVTMTGDIILSRRDIGPAYHLSVVVDDAAQRISEVVRGVDLSEATGIQRLLQAVLELPTPTYHHHRLIRDETGKRLAKRDDARALRRYRAEGATPGDIRAMLGL